MSYRDMVERDSYGVLQSNPINDDIRAKMDSATETVDLDDARLARIVRLRLLSDPGFPMWELSYCYGQLKSGEYVRVRLPEYQWPKRGLERSLVEMAKRAGVYAKGLGLLDPEVISVLQ